MALSGSITTNYWKSSDSKTRGYTLSWSATQSIANNTSTISWTVSTAGTYQYNVAERTLKVVLAGKTLVDKTDRVMRGTGTVASGSFTLTHNSVGDLSISGSITAAVYTSAVNCNASGSWSLNKISRQATISSAPNFNDEANPTITYSNPAGNNVTSLQACISLTGSAADVAYRDISKTGTSYTFNLTDAERSVLRTNTTGSNSRTVKFFVRTVIGGNTFYSSVSKTFTIVNGTPVISPTVVDTNNTTIALTGDANKLIKYYSNAKANLPYELKKDATLSSCSITHNGKTLSQHTHTFNAVESATFDFSLTDSRNNTVKKTITKTFIDYVKLSCNLGSGTPTAEGDFTFNVSGNYFNGSFGATSNTLTVQYRYKTQNGSYTSWANMSVSLSGNEYEASVNLSGLDYRETYVFQARAIDKLATISTEERATKSTPVFSWSDSVFEFNVPVNIQGNIVADYIIERSTEAMGSNGTWQIEKWASGKAVCYGVRNYGNMAVGTAWGNTYESETFTQSFPSGLFIEAPLHLNIHVINSSAYLACGYGYSPAPNKDDTGRFYFYRPNGTSITVSQVHVQFYAIGRWK